MASDLEQAARRRYRLIRKRVRRFVGGVRVIDLRIRNLARRGTLVGDVPVVVSLTSYGTRVSRVAYTIESIASGAARPQRIILWLDDRSLFDDLPRSLRRLQARGLEVLMSENFGPHEKYFPYVESEGTFDIPLVTADDDILYPRSWLRNLYKAHLASPTTVNCYRASVITTVEERVAPYADWPRCTDTVTSITRFATGVSGVLYPVTMLDELASRGRGFLEASPRADDVWLHWVALRAGIGIRQISRTPRHFLLSPGTQEVTLVEENLHRGGNDVLIRGLYTAEDVDRLRRAAPDA